MAKGKSSKGKNYTSKGERKSSISTAKMHTASDRMLYKMAALKKGKNVYFTIENPNKAETNKKFIRVKVDGRQWQKRMEGKA